MARKKISEGDIEYNLLVEWWKWYQAYYSPEDNREYWRDIIESGSALCERYKTKGLGDFCSDLVMAVLNDADRRHKKG